MNLIKANVEICTALAKGERVCGHDVGEDSFFVTATGTYGFCFPKDKIVFDLNKVKRLDKIIFRPEDYVKPENTIRPTIHYIIDGKLIIRRFDGRANDKDYSLWMNSAFLKYFYYPHYYQDKQTEKDLRKQPVIITDLEVDGDEQRACAMLLPTVRYEGDDV